MWHLLTTKSNPAFDGMLIQFSVPVILCPSKCQCLQCNRNDSISINEVGDCSLHSSPHGSRSCPFESFGAEEKWVFVYHFVCYWVHVKYSISNISTMQYTRERGYSHNISHTKHGTRNKANDNNNNNKFNELWWWAPFDVRHESDPIVATGRWIRTSTSSPNVLLGLFLQETWLARDAKREFLDDNHISINHSSSVLLLLPSSSSSTNVYLPLTRFEDFLAGWIPATRCSVSFEVHKLCSCAHNNVLLAVAWSDDKWKSIEMNSIRENTRRTRLCEFKNVLASDSMQTKLYYLARLRFGAVRWPRWRVLNAKLHALPLDCARLLMHLTDHCTFRQFSQLHFNLVEWSRHLLLHFVWSQRIFTKLHFDFVSWIDRLLAKLSALSIPNEFCLFAE